jgi:hypothetical protein
MTTGIAPGQTNYLHGELATGGTLIADAGTGNYGNPAPALIIVNHAAVNGGTIEVKANTGYGVFGAVGATLDVSSRLANNGLIDVQGGGVGSHFGGGPACGAGLINTGVRLGTGTLVVHAAYDAPQEGRRGAAARSSMPGG